jgi:hypothetical protein
MAVDMKKAADDIRQLTIYSRIAIVIARELAPGAQKAAGRNAFDQP